ncbi:MAG: protein kinase domain-containing protein [Dolichospermum sp.]
MTWNPGKILNNGKYTIQSVLGQGGFGVTYLARDTNDIQVVIKTLNDKVQNHRDFPQFQQDFVNEALRLAKCNHPHIVKVYEVIQEGNLWCMVMEYARTNDLDTLIAQEKERHLSENDALYYIQQIGEALDYIHSLNPPMIHRDVKPANILIRNHQGKNQAILIDFGIAREFKQNLTQSQTPFLSDGFAPIEQYDKRARRGAFTDVYALAATLYTMVTGEVPTAAPARMMFPLTPPKQINPQISDRLNQAILQGMELQPENRPQSIEKWFDLLGLAYQGKSVKIYSQSQPRQLSPKTKPKSSVVTTQVIKPQHQKNSLPWIITIGSVVSLLFVTGLVVTQSAHIPIICKPLNNCAVDEEFSSKYKQAKDIAVTAQKLFESAKNVEELRASQEQVQDAIAQLKTIPTSAKIYNTAQKELSDYQNQLTKIQSRLDKENQALDSINEAKQQAQDAEEQMGKAQTVSEYEAVKDKWDKVLAILNDIPSDVFISVTNLKNNYQSKKEKVVTIIGDLNKPTPSPEPTPTSTPTPDPTPSPTNYPTSTPAIEATNKSRREYVCKFLGFNQGVSQGVRLEPSISGSKTRDWDCFVPISSGRCVARGGGNVYEGIGETVGPTGLVSCDGDSITIEDPGTGEKYYQFNAVNGSVRFVLEK